MTATSKPRSTPDAERSTVNARFRVTDETNATVREVAAAEGDTMTLAAVAMVRVAARHRAEVTAEIQALRAQTKKSAGTPLRG